MFRVREGYKHRAVREKFFAVFVAFFAPKSNLYVRPPRGHSHPLHSDRVSSSQNTAASPVPKKQGARSLTTTCTLCTTHPATHQRRYKGRTIRLCTGCNTALKTISHKENCSLEDAYTIAVDRIIRHLFTPAGLNPERVQKLTQQ